MNAFNSLGFGVLFLFSVAAFAQEAVPFDKTSFLREGLSLVTTSLQTHLKDEGLADDRACPKGGMELVENLNETRAKLSNALDSVQDLIRSVKPAAEQRKSEAQRCGSCRQNNVVSSYASISPAQTMAIPECGNKAAETFTLDVDDESRIKDYTEQILSGASQEGKRLARACPDPCSFYVTTAQTNLDNGKIHYTMTVQCGQPRKGSVIFADYEYKAGLIHQWTCSK